MSMTFAQELRHVVSVEPVKDSDTGPRTPRPRESKDYAGDEVRVYERDDAEALTLTYDLNTEKGVWEGEVWADIVTMRHGNLNPDGTLHAPTLRAEWLALDQPGKWGYHVRMKAPNPRHAAWWVGYRDGKPAHARLLDRHRPLWEVWIQWIVGTRALGRSGQTLMVALWDVGARQVCGKFLPHHPARVHYDRMPGTVSIEPAELWEVHHPGHYLKWRVELVERPDRPYEHYYKGPEIV